jgi:hypothetical protein
MPEQTRNVEERPLTIREKRDLEKMAEQKKKINVFLSRGSGEESRTGYKNSSTAFAGGQVQSRSRVSLVGQNNEGEVGRAAVGKVRGGLGFAKGGRYGSAKTGFAQKSDYNSAVSHPDSTPSNRPLGFH